MDDLGGKTPIFGNSHMFLLVPRHPTSKWMFFRPFWKRSFFWCREKNPRIQALGLSEHGAWWRHDLDQTKVQQVLPGIFRDPLRTWDPQGVPHKNLYRYGNSMGITTRVFWLVFLVVVGYILPQFHQK